MASGSSQHRCVFVGNIPYDATEEQLVQICEEVGPVVSFRLVIDKETGKPKGYGFCEYKDEETALSARRNLQGYEINGRQLRVDFAENDKGSDRNREQGRGGPGLTSNVDAQKAAGVPSILGDSSLHQPIGLQLASTAASVMVGVLGGPQISGMPLNQNGLQSQSGLGNDPLTHYLARMSKHQLYEIISEMKALATHNKALARQLMQTSLQLPKALFQAQIMLGMVTPQMLQMPNIRQSSSSTPQPLLQAGVQDQKPVLPPHHGQTPQQIVTHVGTLARLPDGHVSTLAQNPLISQPSAPHLQHSTVQPQFQHLQTAQDQYVSQVTIPGKPGVPTVPSARSEPLASFSTPPQTHSLVISKGLLSQTKPPFPQQPRSIGATNVGYQPELNLSNTSIQRSLLPRPMSSQPGFSNYPVLHGGLEMASREAGTSTSFTHDPTWASRNGMHPSPVMGLAEQTRVAKRALESTNHPLKRVKLEDGSGAPQMTNSSTVIIKSEPVQASVSQMAGTDGMQDSEKQSPQLPPEVESALLQQVMSLTPEQLSSLPPEQRQQVIQLQQMLR